MVRRVWRGVAFVAGAALWLAGAVALGDTLEPPEVDEEEAEALLEKLRAEALDDFRLIQKRIQVVSYRLAVGGAPICGEAVSPVIGALVARRNDYLLHAKREEAAAAFGVGELVQVLAIAPGSPAERAGIQEGDEILEVDGRSITRTKHVFMRLRASKAGNPTFRVRRGPDELELDVPREIGCDSGVFVEVSSEMDTGPHPNRKEIWVASGLADFVQSDDEMAIVIAHQIGHRLIGNFRSAERELEADRLGLYLAARAGFDISPAPALWDRVAMDEPWKIPVDTGRFTIPHGATALRAPMIRATVAEIEEKAANGQPIELAPEE